MNSVSSQPRVSAVIPTRNRPDLLRRAVMSVLRQTLEEVEAVVVVDGPDAATVAMLEDIQDARLRVVALPQSVGGSDARNIGVQHACGEWIGLLDDDDEWFPVKCAQQLKKAEQQTTGTPLVVSMFVAHKANGDEMVQPLRLPSKGEAFAEYMFSPRCGFQTSTFFCRRELLLRVPFASGLKGCQDLDWLLRVTAEPDVPVVVCEEPLAVFHVPETRASVSRGLDWKFRLNWGKSCRRLMTPRAYSLFIVTVCATKAREQAFSLRTFFVLLRECVFRGHASVSIAGHFVALYTTPQWFRHGVRRLLMRPQPGNFVRAVGAEGLARNHSV